MSNSVRKMRNARYNQLRNNSQKLVTFLGHRDADEISDQEMMYLRTLVEEMNQQTHEFNAYRNANKIFP